MNEEKTYTLRGLTADDVFPMFKIISNIGIKEFKSCFENPDVQNAIKNINNESDKSGNSAASVGIIVAFDLAAVIFANLPKCKDDIYTLLSGLSGLTKKEVSALPMNVFINMIVDVIKKEEFSDFFQGVSRLFK